MVRISTTLTRVVSYATTYIAHVDYPFLRKPDGLNFYIDHIQACHTQYISNLV